MMISWSFAGQSLKLMWNKGWWFLKGKNNENCVSEQFHSVWKSTKCLIWIFMWNFFFLNSRMKKRKRANINETFFVTFQHSSLVLLFSTYILNFMEQSVIYQNVNTFIASTFLKILSFVMELKRIYYGMTDSPPITYHGFRGDFFSSLHLDERPWKRAGSSGVRLARQQQKRVVNEASLFSI